MNIALSCRRSLMRNSASHRRSTDLLANPMNDSLLPRMDTTTVIYPVKTFVTSVDASTIWKTEVSAHVMVTAPPTASYNTVTINTSATEAVSGISTRASTFTMTDFTETKTLHDGCAPLAAGALSDATEASTLPSNRLESERSSQCYGENPLKSFLASMLLRNAAVAKRICSCAQDGPNKGLVVGTPLGANYSKVTLKETNHSSTCT